MKTKEEVIKEAYGKYWEFVKDSVDDNGWIDNSISKFTFGQLKNLDSEYKNDVFFRPKSIQGIENNNGWIKINSDVKFQNEDVWIVNMNGNKMVFYHDALKPFDKRYTHYQPIEKPKKLPVY